MQPCRNVADKYHIMQIAKSIPAIMMLRDQKAYARALAIGRSRTSMRLKSYIGLHFLKASTTTHLNILFSAQHM